MAIFALMAVSATAFAQYGAPARPGTLSAVEGQASIEGRALSSRSAGTVSLDAGHVLATANGKAEVLLTPGAFLRVGAESTVEMVSPDLLHTEVRLTRGRAEVEVGQIAPENRLLVDLPGGQTQLMERGLYRFDAESGLVRVFDGKAAVYLGADLSADVHPIDVKGGRELSLSASGASPRKFEKNGAEDDLYRWGNVRSKYMSDEYEGGGYYPGYTSSYYYPGYASGWYGGGPYWAPYGYGLYSGYGFYAPYAFYGGGFSYGGGWGRGFYGGGLRGGGGWRGGPGGIHPGGGRR